ncbi:MAG: hypothetical protein NPIRA01_35020 [Nitrospirales bacterium]|nr:MAG: hypothetical protein NPIRA01_35020 [Nitrospirales bacterium]
MGTSHIQSSTESWAETDLSKYMSNAAQNAPLFIEAIYSACESIKEINDAFYAPEFSMINDICVQHKIGYVIRPPDLILRESEIAPVVEVPQESTTLAEQAIELVQASLRRSETLLNEGRGREAVQELLWLLESVSTAFSNVDTGTGTIEGKYFNKIVKNLRRLHSGTTFERILEWMTNLHGYLSSPTGGGVRHGLNLNSGVVIELNEARLICNLIRSYISFLLGEHERLVNF